jgi:putative transposase
MPFRQESFAAGNYYHLYNRGVNREKIFFSKENFLYCIRLFKKYSHSIPVTIIAYCLMPNHYHLLLRQDGEISLSKYVNIIFNAYVQAVNQQIGRKGTLFAGRFKHIHVDRQEYLLHLARYIHLNPVKAGLVSSAEDWPYSNYSDWIGIRKGTLVDKQFIESYFANGNEYRDFVMDHQIELNLQKEVEKYFLD